MLLVEVKSKIDGLLATGVILLAISILGFDILGNVSCDGEMRPGILPRSKTLLKRFS